MTELDMEEDGDWRLQAACRDTDPNIFYPGRGESHREAKTICRSCPVQQTCLHTAIERGERWGIWGGYSERQRRRMRIRKSRTIDLSRGAA